MAGMGGKKLTDILGDIVELIWGSTLIGVICGIVIGFALVTIKLIMLLFVGGM